MRFDQKKIADAVSMGSTVSSIGIDLNQLALGSIQAVWTGTPAGNFTIQVSNDIVQTNPTGTDPAANVVNWTTYSGSTQAAGGAAGDFMWVLSDIGYRWVRLTYTRSSSTGTLNATFCGKGV